VARIRHIDIRNFRCLKRFAWRPRPGINCIIGPGDSGKSTVLDAIDLCLGARRYVAFSDADFYRLQVTEPISISITIGDLDDNLKSMETYGHYVRSFDLKTGRIEDEPEHSNETVLTLNLSVKSDLEPIWTLASERAAALGQTKYLTWSDRVRLCPTRIGAYAENDLAWRRGSVLTKLSDEKAETSGALAEAARAARVAFGDLAGKQLAETLHIVGVTAKELGISVGDDPKALLDAHSVSFGGGTISLHSDTGVPLRGLGTGSARLLIAGLQRKAAKQATIMLVDEVEYGLEPHRIIRLLQSVGSKELRPPLQAFLTTHSPVVVRELSVEQLFRLKRSEDKHAVRHLDGAPDPQGTVRSFPEAFLAHSVLVCEGASEVGLIRGLDQYRAKSGLRSLSSLGVFLVDAGGCDKLYKRAPTFLALGYRTAVFRDDDKQPDRHQEADFEILGGSIFKWRPARALEDELFECLPTNAVVALLDFAVEIHGTEVVDAQIRSVSNGTSSLTSCLREDEPKTRVLLAKASTTKQSPWFKNVSHMEHIGREIVGPAEDECGDSFQKLVREIFDWMHDDQQ
jgi:putative ATP-dependent endonuclease of OLD family